MQFTSYSVWILIAVLFAGPVVAADVQDPIEAAFRLLAGAETSGAAPGYVADRACGVCHPQRYQSYQAVAMAKSFYRPGADRVIEDFASLPFRHQASDRFYELSLRGDDYWFRRYQLDAHGEQINLFEVKVDWIVGSGNHVRTYLYQTGIGELYQLPLAWYSQAGKWGMQPGYDRPDHNGVNRQIRRECMFCHNAYPEVPVGSDQRAEAHLFPHDLPQGTGCQRCHGPGANHIRTVLSAPEHGAGVAESIVNPGRFSATRRNDICFECHLLPDVAVPPIRRFERSDYSYRPGEPLADYALVMEVEEEQRAGADRFQINHQAYRLTRSRCFQQSQGEMSCTHCHDPHVKLGKAERPAHYRQKCLGCHQDLRHPDASPGQPLLVEEADCVLCHMPERRTQDVVQVTMTDHRIGIHPGRASYLDPLQEQDPLVTDLSYLDPASAPQGDLGELYRLLALLRQIGVAPRRLVEGIEQLLKRSPQISPTPYLDLAKLRLGLREYQSARQALGQAGERGGEAALIAQWSALAAMGEGDYGRALELLEESLKLDDQRPETHYNRALIENARQNYVEAEASLRQVIALRPNQVLAWHYLGRVLRAGQRDEEALVAQRRALEIDPRFRRGYEAIIETLEALQRPQEAIRYRGMLEKLLANGVPAAG